jgi:hypothetical protein
MSDMGTRSKPRKHKWVTEALNEGERTLSVWPSADEVQNDRKKQRFLETVAKVGNDPRVKKIDTIPHNQYALVYIFHIEND